mmetsp:Transcript_71234/g.125322  ORF Transcript_71234/g.125322 Transcript_71234/m.125322 type:complete len:319 (-) Transcript_71234:646-1602(-)
MKLFWFAISTSVNSATCPSQSKRSAMKASPRAMSLPATNFLKKSQWRTRRVAFRAWPAGPYCCSPPSGRMTRSCPTLMADLAKWWNSFCAVQAPIDGMGSGVKVAFHGSGAPMAWATATAERAPSSWKPYRVHAPAYHVRNLPWRAGSLAWAATAAVSRTGCSRVHCPRMADWGTGLTGLSVTKRWGSWGRFCRWFSQYVQHTDLASAAVCVVGASRAPMKFQAPHTFLDLGMNAGSSCRTHRLGWYRMAPSTSCSSARASSPRILIVSGACVANTTPSCLCWFPLMSVRTTPSSVLLADAIPVPALTSGRALRMAST